MKRFLVLLAAAAGPVSASKWVEITTATDGDVVLADAESLKAVSQNVRTVWLSWKYKKVHSNGAVFDKELQRVDCAAESTGIISWIDYNADGTVIVSRTIEAYQVQMTPAAPDTVGAEIVKTVCSVKL